MNVYGYRAARAVMLRKLSILEVIIEAARDEAATAAKQLRGPGQPRKPAEWLAATAQRSTKEIALIGMEWAARPRDAQPKRYTAALELAERLAPGSGVAVGMQVADMVAQAGVIESLNPPLGKHRDMSALALTSEVIESVEPFFDVGPAAPLLAPPQGPPRIRQNWRHEVGATIKGSLVGQTLDAIRATRWAINPHMLAVFNALYPNVKGSRLTLLERAALHQARKLDSTAFYLDGHFDWRGRFYQDGLNGLEWTNASDKTRSLLEFADGFPLQGHDDWLPYLEYHMTSMYGNGVDKQHDTLRRAWVRAHHKQILACSLKPGAFWRRAKEPFRFLAACFAYRGAIAGDPVHLPISFDVTCSGAGIYALLVRDFDLAQLVGIVPSHDGSAQDFYRHFGSLCKPPLDRARAKDYCKGAFYGTTDSPAWPGWAMSDRGLAFWRAMGPHARSLYLWLRSRCLLGDTVSWRLPDGFTVNQSYRQYFTSKESVRVGAQVIRLDRQWRGPECDVPQMLDGVAANFIHSWDGAYLRAVVRTGALLGVPSWGLAHDCFSVHPWAAKFLHGALPLAIQETFGPDRLAALGWSGTPGKREDLSWRILGPIVG